MSTLSCDIRPIVKMSRRKENKNGKIKKNIYYVKTIAVRMSAERVENIEFATIRRKYVRDCRVQYYTELLLLLLQMIVSSGQNALLLAQTVIPCRIKYNIDVSIILSSSSACVSDPLSGVAD